MSVTVECCAFGCPRPGSVLVSAFLCPLPGEEPGPIANDTPVLNALVTTPLKRGTVLGFRFYPHAENYTSVAASAVTFTLGFDVVAGSSLALRSTPDSYAYTGMLLYSRPPGPDGIATLLGTAGSRPVLSVRSSVFVYWAPCYSRIEGISALGMMDTTSELPTPPVMPPQAFVPCKFALTVPDAAAGDATAKFVYCVAAAVPGSWTHAWQVMKWHIAANWAVEANAGYVANVDAAEVRRFVQLQPRQLMAIAYKPYEYDQAPAFSGQLVLLVTSTVPAGTTAYIRGGDWSTTDGLGAHWAWTAPPACALLPGTVVDIGGLRPGAMPTVNIGTIVQGNLVPAATDSFAAYTVFAAQSPPDVTGFMPVTGVYPCSYTGEVPAPLTPGVSILENPWPDCAAILGTSCCYRVASWECFSLQLVQRACPLRWLCQPLPTFVTTGPCADPSACCGAGSTMSYATCGGAAAIPASVVGAGAGCCAAYSRPCCGKK